MPPGKTSQALAIALTALVSVAAGAITSNTWQDVDNLTICFVITGDATASTAVHKATLTVDTHGIAPAAFEIHGPGANSANIPLSSLSYEDNFSTPPPGKDIWLTTSAGIYTLTLEQKPLGSGTGAGTISANETWSLLIKSLATPTTIDATVSATNRLTGDATSHVALNLPPVPTITEPASAPEVVEGHSVDFRGIVSTGNDEDPASVSYSWTFQNGTPSSVLGAGPHTVTYDTVGATNAAELTATDNTGQPGKAQMNVTVVDNVAPEASITEPVVDVTIGVGQTVTFKGDVSDEFVDDVTYTWTFEGGNPGSATGTGTSILDGVVVTYNTLGGPYTATLEATDDAGQDDATPPTRTVTVTGNQAPIASCAASPQTAAAPASISFSSAGSHDTDGSIQSYAWDFGDSGTSNSPNPSHPYNIEGVYHVMLTVTDNQGGIGTDGTEVTILPNPNLILVFPRHRGVPYNPNPPTIDGTVAPDVGWRGAFRLTYEDGTKPNAAVQGLRHRTDEYLYLSFEIQDDRTFDSEDLIVLCFRPDASSGSDANDRKIMLHPFAAGHTPSQDVAPAEVLVKAGAAGWQNAAGTFDAKVSSHDGGSAKSWEVEIRVPTSVATGGSGWVDFSSQFRFSFHLIVVSSEPGNIGEIQHCWPRGTPWAAGVVQQYAFPAEWWVRADRSGATANNGVYFKSAQDIGTTNTPPSAIKLPTEANRIVTDTFFANVWNDTHVDTTTGEDYQIVPNVSVLFRLANWGLPAPGDWTPIPAPPPAAQPLAAGNASGPVSTPFSMDWTLNWDNAGDQVYILGLQPPNQHQCMLAEIDAPGNTMILSKSVHRNMDFVPASTFSRVASVGTKGYGPPAGGESKHAIRIMVSEQELKASSPDALLARGTELSARGPENATSRYEWIASGYLEEDDSIIIKGRRFHRLQPIGSFGYVAQHEGSVEQWAYAIEGARRVGKNAYEIEVAPETSARIVTTITPRAEAQTAQVSLHAGTATSLAGPAPPATTGFAFELDAGYRFAQHASALLMAGASFIDPATPATWWLNANAVLRLDTVTIPGLYAFADLGFGGYLPIGGPLEPGWNVGIGVSRKMSRHLSLELAGEWHTTFVSRSSFVQALVGAVWRF